MVLWLFFGCQKRYKTFKSPSSGNDSDWILVLDDASKFSKAPGE